MRQAPRWSLTSRRRVTPRSAGTPRGRYDPTRARTSRAPPPHRLPVVLDRGVRCEDAADGPLGRGGRLRGDRLRPLGAGAPPEGRGGRLPHRASRLELEDGGARSAPKRGACRRETASHRERRRRRREPRFGRRVRAGAGTRTGTSGEYRPESLPSRCLGRRAAARNPETDPVLPAPPLGWAAALEPVVQPADIWHGMWAGSLPALGRLRRRHGGRTVYDSRDVFLHSRAFDRMHPAPRRVLQAFERHWAQRADAVITVNEAYATILERTLRIDRPATVMNCPVRWVPPTPRPNRIREALSIPPDMRVALYQGNLMSDRGIEQSMDAILEVPDAVLALLGYGALRHGLEALSRSAAISRTGVPATAGAAVRAPGVDRQRGRPGDGHPADVAQPPLHDPQKLFEAIAAEVPVVAADLPGMARDRPFDGHRRAVRPNIPCIDRRWDPRRARGEPHRANRVPRARTAGRRRALQLGSAGRNALRCL